MSLPPSREQAASVGATLYSVWRSRFIASTVDRIAADYRVPEVDGQRALTALKRALSGAPSASGVDYFAAAGVADLRDRRGSRSSGRCGPGSTGWTVPTSPRPSAGPPRLADYRWGRLHRLTLDSGPARRYVGVVGRGAPVGRSSLPGGTSALPTDRHYLDLLPAYLTDDSYLVRVRRAEVAAAESVTVPRP